MIKLLNECVEDLWLQTARDKTTKYSEYIHISTLCLCRVVEDSYKNKKQVWIYESLQKIRDKVYQLKYQRFEKYLLSLVIWELMFQTPPSYSLNTLLIRNIQRKISKRSSMLSITVSSSHNQCKEKLPFMIIFIFTR